jgi:hypothetical protein
LEFQSLEKIKLRNHEYLELGLLKICRILIVPPDSYLNTVVKTPAQRKKERKNHPPRCKSRHCINTVEL